MDIQAYRDTHYHVHVTPPFTLTVGQASLELQALQTRHNTTCSAYITAWNPFSQALNVATNAQRQALLVEQLRHGGWAYVPGVGQHPSNGWPGEESFLVLGMGLAEARSLGEQFEQNAILWSGADGVPGLVMLR